MAVASDEGFVAKLPGHEIIVRKVKVDEMLVVEVFDG